MICKVCKLDKSMDEYSTNKTLTCLCCKNNISKNSYKQLIRHSYLYSSINGIKITNMLPNELKMILDDYNFIFNNYVDARNKILNNQVEFDYDFISIPFTKEQKLEEGIKQKSRDRIINRITSNRFKLESLGITSLFCTGCSETLELSNYIISNDCYQSKCKKCRRESIDVEKKRAYEREWRRNKKQKINKQNGKRDTKKYDKTYHTTKSIDGI